jgi:hypothetical protein
MGQGSVNTMSIYEIRVRGHLDQQWSSRFAGLTMSYDEDGTTLLRGELVDEAAVYGVLMNVRDLAVPLLSVHCVSTPPEKQEHHDVS